MEGAGHSSSSLHYGENALAAGRQCARLPPCRLFETQGRLRTLPEVLNTRPLPRILRQNDHSETFGVHRARINHTYPSTMSVSVLVTNGQRKHRDQRLVDCETMPLVQLYFLSEQKKTERSLLTVNMAMSPNSVAES